MIVADEIPGGMSVSFVALRRGLWVLPCVIHLGASPCWAQFVVSVSVVLVLVRALT